MRPKQELMRLNLREPTFFVTLNASSVIQLRAIATEQDSPRTKPVIRTIGMQKTNEH